MVARKDTDLQRPFNRSPDYVRALSTLLSARFGKLKALNQSKALRFCSQHSALISQL